LVHFLDISATQYTAEPHRQAAHRSEVHRRRLERIYLCGLRLRQ